MVVGGAQSRGRRRTRGGSRTRRPRASRTRPRWPRLDAGSRRDQPGCGALQEDAAAQRPGRLAGGSADQPVRVEPGQVEAAGQVVARHVRFVEGVREDIHERHEGVACALAGRRHAPHPDGRDGDRLDPRCHLAPNGGVSPELTRRPPPPQWRHGRSVVRAGRRGSGSLALEERVLCCPSGSRAGRPSLSAEWRTSRTTRGSTDRGTISATQREGSVGRAALSGDQHLAATATGRRRQPDLDRPGGSMGSAAHALRRGGRPGSSRSACRTTARADHPNRSSSWPSRASGGTDARLAAPTARRRHPAPMAHGLDDLVGGIGASRSGLLGRLLGWSVQRRVTDGRAVSAARPTRRRTSNDWRVDRPVGSPPPAFPLPTRLSTQFSTPWSPRNRALPRVGRGKSGVRRRAGAPLGRPPAGPRRRACAGCSRRARSPSSR